MATTVREQDSPAQGPLLRPAHANKTKPRKKAGPGRWIFGLLLVAGVGGLAAGAARFTIGGGGANTVSRIQTYTVTRGELVVTV